MRRTFIGIVGLLGAALILAGCRAGDLAGNTFPQQSSPQRAASPAARSRPDVASDFLVGFHQHGELRVRLERSRCMRTTIPNLDLKGETTWNGVVDTNATGSCFFLDSTFVSNFSYRTASNPPQEGSVVIEFIKTPVAPWAARQIGGSGRLINMRVGAGGITTVHCYSRNGVCWFL